MNIQFYKANLIFSHAYLGVDGVEEPQGDAIEEELVVPDSRGHVLLLEDLIVVDAELKVGGTIPSRVRGGVTYS